MSTIRPPVSRPTPRIGAAPRLALGLVALAGAALAPLLVPTAAEAHAIVIDSNPKVNDTLGVGGNVLKVHFNSRIDRARSKLTIIAADKTEVPVTMQASPDDETLTGQVTLPFAGSFKLRWQVLAVDGHTTRGDIPFTVTQP
ncbi:copper resistance CopC family protein [Azospirillum sp. B4]|uniref:copper resistance CopC family protein n=1 Tax=Azospirillum sp. B4 TaxID=95605 RepID=UPI00034689DA|nr:copper resistance CopC family protein [Azospirillum sp. B4]